MAQEEDLLLARRLMASGALTKEQVSRCLVIVDQREVLGIRTRLAEVAVELGFASAEALARAAPSPSGGATGAEPARPAPDHSAAAPPRELGGFRLVRRIGSGALGTVWEAVQVSLDKRVALKLLKPEYARNRELVERFLREAQAAARLVHPNVVQAIAAGEEGGVYYFAMDYVEGRNLKQLVDRRGPLPEKQALTIALKVAEGLAAASACGLVHRDIKPANIILTPTGAVKIADLGLARPPGAAEGAGTPHYMSPEQVSGSGPVDVRSDIYSLGATLFHLLAGTAPFSRPSIRDVLLARLQEEPPDVRSVRPEVSTQAAAFTRRLMAREVADRPQSPQEVVSLLSPLLDRPAAQAPPSPRRKAPSRPVSRGRPARPAGRPARAARGAPRPEPAPRRAPEPEDDGFEEPVRTRAPRTFLLAGLGFGVVLSLAVAAIMLKGPDPERKKAQAVRVEEETRASDQEGERDKFLSEIAEEEDKAEKALARLLANTEIDREELAAHLGRILKRYARTSKAPLIAAELDRVRGTLAAGAGDALEKKFAQARAKLDAGKPYEANLFLVDEFTSEEQSALGARYNNLIEECARTIERIELAAETRARELAKQGAAEEIRKVLGEARLKVDPATRKKLLELEDELTGTE